MPAHLTAMDGGNAEGLQEQSRPCAGRRLALATCIARVRLDFGPVR
jgi:hypothetical protein